MTRLSIAIPVFQSAAFVSETVARSLAVLDTLEGGGEVVLVNDASPDESWAVLTKLAESDERVVAIDLARNVGQHRAIAIGMAHSRGDWVVTIDDDLQNPPEEIPTLLEKANEGHDLVFGKFRVKHHASTRVAGSRLVTRLNRLIYGLPRDMVVSNVRLIRRDVVERMLARLGKRTYLTGLALLCATSPANATIDHFPREVGASTYTARKLLKLFTSIVTAHPRFNPPRELLEDGLVRHALNVGPRPSS